MMTDTTEFMFIMFKGFGLGIKKSERKTVSDPEYISYIRKAIMAMQTLFFWPLIFFVPLFKGHYNQELDVQ